MHYQCLLLKYEQLKCFQRASLNIRSFYEPQGQQKSLRKMLWEMLG